MKTLINNLFNQSGLRSIELSFGTLHTYENENKHSYWLVIESVDLNNIVEKQPEYFADAKQTVNDELFDKNVNMLILYRVDGFDNVENSLLEVEENPYLFKKQVILYSQKEVEKLLEAIDVQDLPIKDFIEHQILQEEIFKNHKDSINKNEYESLLYRLAHKIPFISLNILQESGLEALTDNNRRKISNGLYSKINSSVEQNFFNRITESIEDMSPDIIYNILLPILPSDEN